MEKKPVTKTYKLRRVPATFTIDEEVLKAFLEMTASNFINRSRLVESMIVDYLYDGNVPDVNKDSANLT